MEAGIVLLGPEVKSLRRQDHHRGWLGGDPQGRGVAARIEIVEYKWANQFNYDVGRTRKLLLHKQELGKLAIKTSSGASRSSPLPLLQEGKVKAGAGAGDAQEATRQARRQARG